MGTACQGAGRCGEMVHVESAHPPSFLGVIAAAGCVSCSSELRKPRSSSTAPAWAAVGRQADTVTAKWGRKRNPAPCAKALLL